MHRFAIWQKNDAEVAIVHLPHLCPTTNTPVGLHGFADWRGDGAFYPLVSDHRSIRPEPDGRKVGGNLHQSNIAKAREASMLRPNVGVQRPPKAVRWNEGLARTRHTTSHNIRIHAGFDAEARIAGMESSMMPLCIYFCVASRAAVRIA